MAKEGFAEGESMTTKHQSFGLYTPDDTLWKVNREVLLILSGAYTFAELDQTFLPFFPLMFLPEAFLNGWIMAVLVAFRPEWVYSFSDEQYLKGK